MASEIPETWVRAYDDGSIECWGQPEHGVRLQDCCRRAGLAAAAPLIQQATANEIAAEQEQYGFIGPAEYAAFHRTLCRELAALARRIGGTGSGQ